MDSPGALSDPSRSKTSTGSGLVNLTMISSTIIRILEALSATSEMRRLEPLDVTDTVSDMVEMNRQKPELRLEE